jgi:hypothetical protein
MSAKKVIRLTIEKMQELNAGVDGINTAPAKYPGSLNTAQLPMALTWARDSNISHATAGDLYRIDREFEIEVYVDPVGQGDGIDGPIQKCYQIIEEMTETYVDPNNVILYSTAPQLWIQTGGDDISDGGHEILTYPPGGTEQYHGFSFTVRVTGKW